MSNNRYRSSGPGGGLRQIEGRRPVLEALRAGRPLRRVLVSRGEGETLDEIITLARSRGVPVDMVPRVEMDRLSQSRSHQGTIAYAEAEKYLELDDLLEVSRQRGEPPLVVVAAGIQDPQNLGSLMRSAEGAGFHGLVLPRHRAAPVTPVVAKAAAGAAEYLPLAQVTNLARALENLKEAGLWVYGADAEGTMPYWEADLKGPTAIVVGGEGRGLPRLVAERCDILLRIPMRGHIASLNAGVAGAILMFEAAQQRR